MMSYGVVEAADHQLLLGAGEAVPELDAVADDPDDGVGAAGVHRVLEVDRVVPPAA
jgi:hypothetical protein